MADYEIKHDDEFETRVSECLAQFSHEQFEKIGRAVARTLLATDFPIATVFLTDRGRSVSIKDAFGETIGCVQIAHDRLRSQQHFCKMVA